MNVGATAFTKKKKKLWDFQSSCMYVVTNCLLYYEIEVIIPMIKCLVQIGCEMEPVLDFGK
jgi:hypothetical protein